MSVLTKVFVVSLVVLSLLLAAAAVTFVGTVPDLRRQITDVQTQLRQARDAEARAGQRLEAQLRAAESHAGQLNSSLAAARENLAQSQTQIARLEAEKVNLQGQLAQAQTTQATLSSAVNAGQTLIGQLREQTGTLRDSYDRALQQYTEASRQLAETSNELVFTQRELRRLLEEHQEMEARAEILAQQVREFGGTPERTPVGAPPISGRVLATDTIGGVPYAMISVGREDDVREGMSFVVLDPEDGSFLGRLRIESVDDTESVGVLTGPQVERVRVDAEVRTQLRSS